MSAPRGKNTSGRAGDVLAYIARAERYPEVERHLRALMDMPAEALEAALMRVEAQRVETDAEMRFMRAKLAAMDVGV